MNEECPICRTEFAGDGTTIELKLPSGPPGTAWLYVKVHEACLEHATPQQVATVQQRLRREQQRRSSR